MAPLLPLLAQYAQSPDGAEMVSVAVNGGVLHPSGIPLQWWINRLFVVLWPGEPGLALSFVSWLGGWGTLTCLILMWRKLGGGLWVAVLAGLALVYSPIFALMSLTPEKYTWLTFMQMFFVYQLACVVLDRDYSLRALAFLGLSCGLAFAQHSANVILLPPFLYVVLRPVMTGAPIARGPALGRAFVAVAVAGGVTAGLYLSLLAQRSSLPWPDWGQLDMISDVWNHVVRQDYGVVNLYNNSGLGQNSISAPGLLFKSLFGWHLAFLMIPMGMLAAWREPEARSLMGFLWMILLPGLAVLASTKMPSADLNTVMGYQERYPILLLPVLMLFWAWGVQFLLMRFRRWSLWALLAVAASVVAHAGQGFWLHLDTNNNLIEIYREQARSEFVEGTVFWTGSDMTGFYGIPSERGGRAVDGQTRYPVKALFGMEWYREKTLPRLAPGLSGLLKGSLPPSSIEELFRMALMNGISFTLTEPTRFVAEADIMTKAEQLGVLWTFRPDNQSLYTRRILDNSLRLCDRFPEIWRGLPREGLWFAREYLDAFRFAFMSAGDFLQSQSQADAAAAARAVAESLVPGRAPREWVERCGAYKGQVRRSFSRFGASI